MPAQDWNQRDVLDHQFSHGVRLNRRPTCVGPCTQRQCARNHLAAFVSDVVEDYLSSPQWDDGAMPLVTLRLWLRRRMQCEVFGEICVGRQRYALDDDALDVVTWAVSQPYSGLVVVPVKQRQRAAA